MPPTAQRMREMRARRRRGGQRELRLLVPDMRLPDIRARIAGEIARLDPAAEAAALDWIEAVGEFDAPDETGDHAPR